MDMICGGEAAGCWTRLICGATVMLMDGGEGGGSCLSSRSAVAGLLQVMVSGPWGARVREDADDESPVEGRAAAAGCGSVSAMEWLPAQGVGCCWFGGQLGSCDMAKAMASSASRGIGGGGSLSCSMASRR